MIQKIIYLLKGKFLINDNALKNWLFIIYASVLGLIMIATSHSGDHKVFLIAKISEDIKELRSIYVENKSKLRYVRLKSTLVKRMKNSGIQFSERPLKRIVVKTPRDGK